MHCNASTVARHALYSATLPYISMYECACTLYMCRRSCVWQMDVYKARCSSILFNRHGEQNTHTHIAIHSLCMWIAQGDSVDKRNWPKNIAYKTQVQTKTTSFPRLFRKFLLRKLIWPPSPPSIHEALSSFPFIHIHFSSATHASHARSLRSLCVPTSLSTIHFLFIWVPAATIVGSFTA